MITQKLGRHGELVPQRGFSRQVMYGSGEVPHSSRWRSHDGLVVISGREDAYLPGSGEPPLVGPQWLVSVSRREGGRSDRRCRATSDDVARVVDGFGMPAFDEDNHHPGVARHLWCPIDEQYRLACECKLTEITITIDSEYSWTTDTGEACRGCEYERLMGGGKYPCPLHSVKERA